MAHACIQVHHGKTQVWVAVRFVRPDVTVWKGSSLPATSTRVEGLGDSSIGRGKVENRPPSLTESRGLTTLNRFRFLQIMCGSTRANFWLRSVGPDLAEEVALGDTTAEVCTILGRPTDPEEAHVLASLSFSGGGLGFADARRTRKLGRHPRDGQETTPSLCRDYDRTVGDGDHSNFRSRA